MKNVLIIGIEGKLGSTLKSCLELSGINVYGTSYNTMPCTSFLDLAHPENYIPPEDNIDVIYLCAGITDIKACEMDPKTTTQINVRGIIEVAKKFIDKKPLIIFLSTNHVFSGKKPYISTLETPCPQNQYGLQKNEVEKWLLNIYKNAVILRLTKVIDTNLTLLRTWHDSLQQGKLIEAFTDMTFSPILIEHVMNSLIKLGQIKIPGIFHVSGEKDISYFDFAKLLNSKIYPSQNLVKPISAHTMHIDTIFRPQFTSLDCTETYKTTGFKPPSSSDVLEYLLKVSNN